MQPISPTGLLLFSEFKNVAAIGLMFCVISPVLHATKKPNGSIAKLVKLSISSRVNPVVTNVVSEPWPT